MNSLVFQPWLMEVRTASFFYRQFVEGKLNLPELKKQALEKIASKFAGLQSTRVGTYVWSTYAVKASDGSFVAVMPVLGTLTKRGEFCSYGMRDYMSEIIALNNNEEITAIVMDMEGPGGTVDGLKEFSMVVAASKKPVVVFGDNMVASADYYVASQAKYIIGNANNPTEFGSIGVLCMHEYWGKFIEENIGSVKIIRAPQSVDKALVNPVEPLPKAEEDKMIADMAILCNDFLQTVKTGRGNNLKASDKEWGTGKMFKVDECIQMGLIDAKGTLWDAINKAADLGSGTSKKGTNSNANTTMNKLQIAEKAASLIMGKAVKVSAAAQPAAAEGATPPMWTAEAIYNTDGSGDGAECIHPDTEGNNRQFITKVDNNKGNEPPTDPTITEDDNWLLDNDAAETTDGGAGAKGKAKVTTVGKLNAQLKAEREAKQAAETKAAQLQAENEQLKSKFAANEKKPAAPSTTVISKSVEGDGKERELSKAEQEVEAYSKISNTNIFKD